MPELRVLCFVQDSMMRIFFAIFTMLVLGACASMPRPAPPTPQEVVQMSKEKADPAEIIRRMRDSYAVYRLSASELARLREQGVPDVVIDYMQSTYLEAVRREESDRLYPYHMWTPGLGFMYPPHGLWWPYGPVW